MQPDTPDILKNILDYKKEYVDHVKRNASLQDLKHRSNDSETISRFYQ